MLAADALQACACRVDRRRRRNRRGPNPGRRPAFSVARFRVASAAPGSAELARCASTAPDAQSCPQIPLTLTNAIIVTAAVSRQLFPKELHPVNERNLAITTGLGNLIAAPFFWGLSDVSRCGRRRRSCPGSARAPRLRPFSSDVCSSISVSVSGKAAMRFSRQSPDAVLGSLLLFSGIELALSARLQDHGGEDLFLVLLMAAIGVALNPAAAFAVGLQLAYAFRHG